MLISPRKIHATIDANFKCMRQAVREETGGRRERTHT